MTTEVAPTADPVRAAVPTRPAGIRESRGRRAFQALNVTLLLGICVLTVYPLLNVLARSLSDERSIRAGEVTVWPSGFNLDTYRLVVADQAFWTSYGNTVLYTVTATAISMVLTTTYAYVLSKHHLKGRGLLIGIAVFTMFFNGGLIPNYVLISGLGLTNTLWAVVLPNAISVFNLLVMKAFFENMPRDLEEAAAIDGLSTYGILWRIVLPLSKAVLATMVLFYAVANWNSWFTAFLYLDQADRYPVTVYLRNMISGATGTSAVGASTEAATAVSANIQAVTMVLIMVPIISVYPFVQRYFVSGVMLGAVKQ